MRQLPASLSVDADPTKLVKSLKDEEGDLVTPVQQKLLKRILSEVTPKREPVTPRRAPKREPTTTPLKPSRIPVKIPKKQTSSKNVSWDELPFAQEGPELDIRYEQNFKKDAKNICQIFQNTTTPQNLKTG